MVRGLDGLSFLRLAGEGPSSPDVVRESMPSGAGVPLADDCCEMDGDGRYG